jgi:hypothetical protein
MDEVKQETEGCEKEEEAGKGRKKVSLMDESDGESEQGLDRWALTPLCFISLCGSLVSSQYAWR